MVLLCFHSGCGHPLGSLVSFVTIDRQQRFPLEEFSFVWCRSLTRPLSVCLGS